MYLFSATQNLPYKDHVKARFKDILSFTHPWRWSVSTGFTMRLFHQSEAPAATQCDCAALVWTRGHKVVSSAIRLLREVNAMWTRRQKGGQNIKPEPVHKWALVLCLERLFGNKSQIMKWLAKCLHFLQQKNNCPACGIVIRNKSLTHHSASGSQSLSYSTDWKCFSWCVGRYPHASCV